MSHDLFLIKRYSHEAHYRDICDICANVYGGTDYVPSNMALWSADPDTHLLVALSHSDESVLALICYQWRGASLWMFGLRVRESLQGRGLATQLVRSADAKMFEELGGAGVILSTTATFNLAMASIFRKLQYREEDTLQIFPSSQMVDEYLQHVEQEDGLSGDTRNAPRSGVDRNLESPSGARVALQADAEQDLLTWHLQRRGGAGAIAQAGGGTWRACESVEELRRVIAELRAAAGKSAEGHRLWLPAVWEVLDLNSVAVANLVAGGSVWLLGANEQPLQSRAVMVLQPRSLYSSVNQDQAQRLTAGIIAGGLPGLMASFQKALAVAPLFEGYIHLLGDAVPAWLDQGPQFIIFSKECDRRAASCVALNNGV